MEFHSLARKELQALCKLNKIPANMTNVAMADALKSLEIVEGIEDFLKPLESVTGESSIDSPERNVVTSPKVPRTGKRTSTRTKPVPDETPQTVTRTSTRRTTRRAISGEMMEEAKLEFPKTPAVRSTRKAVQTATSMKEEKKVEPAVVSNSQRKAAVSTVKKVYSTRRSARLADKEMVESIPIGEEITQSVKIDSLDLGVLENMSLSGNDSQTVPQEPVKKSDVVASEAVDLKGDDDVQEKTGDNDEVDGRKEKPEELSQAHDELNIQEEHSNSLMIQSETELCQHERVSEIMDDPEFLSVKKSDVATQSAGDVKDSIQEETSDYYEDVPEEKPEELSEAHDELNIQEEHSDSLMIQSKTELCQHERVSEIMDDPEFLSVKKSDAAMESVGDLKDSIQEETRDYYEVDVPEAKPEDISEALDELSENDGVARIELSEDNKGIDISETKLEVANEGFDATEVLTNVNFEEDVEMAIQGSEKKGSSDVGVDLSLSDSENQTKPVKLENSGILTDTDMDSKHAASDMKTEILEREVEVFHSDAENPSEDLTLQNSEEFKCDTDLDSGMLAAEKDVQNLVAPQLTMGSLPEANVDLDSERSLIKDLGVEVATDLSVQETLIAGLGANDENDTEPTLEQSVKTPASVKQSHYPALEKEVSILADDPLTNQFPSSVAGNIASPTRWTPVKKPSSKTPRIKVLTQVTDDKENIDHSGIKLELPKDWVKKNKKEIVPNVDILKQKSLRELTKMFKEKCQIKNNTTTTTTAKADEEEKHTSKVEKMRPALKMLSSENCLAASNLEN